MSHLMEITHFRPITFTGGTGPYLIDDKGQKYLDFFCDVGTASLGYNCSEIRKARSRLKDSPIHAPNRYGYADRERAAATLCDLTAMSKVFFCSSGAEAVEAAIKLARRHQWLADHRAVANGCNARKSVIWSPRGGFHGRTLATLAAGDGPNYHREGFGSLPVEFMHFDEIKEIQWENAAAVLLAPIFGNNDVRMYTLEWLSELFYTSHCNNVLIIADEVQTGSGRASGKISWAQEHNFYPDILCLAKGIAMGAPVGVMLAHGEVANAFTPGTHWSTFGGNPLSMIYTNVFLEWISQPRNRMEITRKGRVIRAKLREYGWAQNIRGDGMLNAFDIDIDTIKFAEACEEERLLIGAFRAGPGAVKITPPLNIKEKVLLQGLDLMDQVYKRLTKTS